MAGILWKAALCPEGVVESLVVATSYLERIVGRMMMVAPYLERIVGRKSSYLERIVGRLLLEMTVVTAERTGGEGWLVVVFEPASIERVVVGRRVRRGR